MRKFIFAKPVGFFFCGAIQPTMVSQNGGMCLYGCIDVMYTLTIFTVKGSRTVICDYAGSFATFSCNNL